MEISNRKKPSFFGGRRRRVQADYSDNLDLSKKPKEPQKGGRGGSRKNLIPREELAALVSWLAHEPL